VVRNALLLSALSLEGLVMIKLDKAKKKSSKNHLGNASQFSVAAELCRRGHSAAVTIGNTPTVDILCSNLKGTKFVHIQVKTFLQGASRCMVGQKAEKNLGPTFFWVLTGLAPVDSDKKNEFFVIPPAIMAKNVTRHAKKFHSIPNPQGSLPKKTTIRIVPIPPKRSNVGWSIKKFRNDWSLIDAARK
jgi:hypothetical protein